MSTNDRPRTRQEFNRRLEDEATRLLAESVRQLGRGQYPFYSATCLRHMAEQDAGLSADTPEAQAPPAPIRSTAAIWRLARKARLNSLERDLLRCALDGVELVAAAELLCISRRRAVQMLRAVASRIEDSARASELTIGEQVAEVYFQETRRYGYSPAHHCQPGREACKRTGVCPYRRPPVAD